MEALRRYTSVEKMLEYLTTERLYFSDPKYWEDKNDAFMIKLYQEKLQEDGQRINVQLLCFAKSEETYLHWKAYGKEGQGVCIIFNSEKLDHLADIEGVTHQYIKYIRLSEARTKSIKIEDLPFTKRFPYESEKEYRYIYANTGTNKPRFYLKVPLELVERIIIGHKIGKQESKLIRAKIKEVFTKKELLYNTIQTGVADTKTFQSNIMSNTHLFPS